MKNNTSFSDEEINGIVDKVSNECSNCSMSIRQVINMANIVDKYSDIFNNHNDKLLALDYASMIRSQIVFHMNHVVPYNELVNYRNKQYITLEGITKRVIIAMYPEKELEQEFNLYEIDDKQIKMNIDMMLKDLQIEMLERAKGMDIKLKKKLDNKEDNK